MIEPARKPVSERYRLGMAGYSPPHPESNSHSQHTCYSLASPGVHPTLPEGRSPHHSPWPNSYTSPYAPGLAPGAYPHRPQTNTPGYPGFSTLGFQQAGPPRRPHTCPNYQGGLALTRGPRPGGTLQPQVLRGPVRGDRPRCPVPQHNQRLEELLRMAAAGRAAKKALKEDKKAIKKALKKC